MSSKALKYSLKKAGVNLFSPLHILMIATDPLHSNVTELAVDECLNILLLVNTLKNELMTGLEAEQERRARAAIGLLLLYQNWVWFTVWGGVLYKMAARVNYICSCFFHRNIYLQKYKYHVHYYDDQKFIEDYSEVNLDCLL